MKEYNQKLYQMVKSGKLDKPLQCISTDVQPYKNRKELRNGVGLDSVSTTICSTISTFVVAVIVGLAWGWLDGTTFDFQSFFFLMAVVVISSVVRYFVLAWACEIESLLAHEHHQAMFNG